MTLEKISRSSDFRYLALGDLSWDPWDIRFFFPRSDFDYLNTGPRPDVFGRQREKYGVIAAKARQGAYEMIFVGNDFFPYFNPRKSGLNNTANLIWKLLTRPNLLKSRCFPYRRLRTPLVGIDLEDRPVVDNRRFRILDQCVCFFKRELPANPCNAFLYTTAKAEDSGNVLHSKIFQRWIKKLRPISLGVDPEACRQCANLTVGKKTDVFFAGELANRPNRLAGIRQLERLRAEGVVIDIAPEKLSRSEFLRRCAQAHLVWSPEGFGWDCFRHYEIALVGSVPLMQSPTIQRYAPFVAGEHALYYFVEGDHLAACVRQALQNRPQLVAMGQAARQHVLQWHTHEALGRYVIEETRRTVAATAGAG